MKRHGLIIICSFLTSCSHHALESVDKIGYLNKIKTGDGVSQKKNIYFGVYMAIYDYLKLSRIDSNEMIKWDIVIAESSPEFVIADYTVTITESSGGRASMSQLRFECRKRNGNWVVESMVPRWAT